MLKQVICNECKSKGRIYVHDAQNNYYQDGIVGYNLTERNHRGSLIMASIIDKCKYHEEEK